MRTNMIKPGDVICFVRPIKSSSPATYSWSKVDAGDTLGELIIPADTPVQLVRMNTVHVFIKYKNRTIKLRRIDNRMYHAGEAAQILYGENK